MHVQIISNNKVSKQMLDKGITIMAHTHSPEYLHFDVFAAVGF